MTTDTPMERLEAMAVEREVEAETIRGNKFRSHAYALEHELAASDLRWALAEIVRLTADCARKDHVANEWADMATSGLQWLKNIRDGVSTTDTAIENMISNLAHCQEAAASARGEG